ncbi:MAG: helix-turn-helix transcriptional regulator [Oscillospiraceae bacterium]|nr:helix-turn-helix transcriptional regulator [Oscillospiraceae bacterium]
MDQTQKNPRPGTQIKKAQLLEKISAYVDRNLTEKITLQMIAAHCSVSISTVTQLFQKVLHTTFHSYVTQRRMVAAEDLIRCGVPLEEVGRKVGFQDHSSFYRAFRQSFGMSPREYRRQKKQSEP